MKKVISLEQLPPVVTLTRMKLGSQGIRPAKHSIDGNADCHVGPLGLLAMTVEWG